MRKVKTREYIKLVIASCIGAIIGSLSIGYANTILYAGNEVSYDNSTSGLNATTVQGALDEMCTVADFSDRVSNVESDVSNLKNPYKVEFTNTSGGGTGGYIDFHYNGSTSDYTSRIIESSSGVLNLIASNGVKINGSTVNKVETVNCALNSSTVSSGTITCKVKNGIAQVFGYGIILKATGNAQTIATGLPKAALQTQTNLASYDAASTAQISAAGDVVWLSTNDTILRMHAGSTYNYTHFFSLTYIVADS